MPEERLREFVRQRSAATPRRRLIARDQTFQTTQRQKALKMAPAMHPRTGENVQIPIACLRSLGSSL
jgi:hypothetical protein